MDKTEELMQYIRGWLMESFHLYEITCNPKDKKHIDKFLGDIAIVKEDKTIEQGYLTLQKGELKKMHFDIREID